MMDFEKKWLKGGNIFDSRDTYKYVGVFDEILKSVGNAIGMSRHHCSVSIFNLNSDCSNTYFCNHEGFEAKKD